MSFTEHIHFFILSNYTNIVILNEVKNLISVSSCIQILRVAQDDKVEHYSLYFFNKKSKLRRKYAPIEIPRLLFFSKSKGWLYTILSNFW